MKTNGKKKVAQSLFQQAERALREAVAEAIETHRRAGEPISVWQDGKVVRFVPSSPAVRETRAPYRHRAPKARP